MGLPAHQTANVDILGYPIFPKKKKTGRCERRLTTTKTGWMPPSKRGGSGEPSVEKKKKKSVARGNVARSDTDDDEMEEATAGCPRVTV